MLVVKLKRGERVRIGEAVVTLLPSSRDGRVKLGIAAPLEIVVRRLDAEGADVVPAAERDGDEFSKGIL